MAESDGKPASSPLSTEEADRLSERFKPSWEAEPEPPTIPKVDPPKPNPLAKQTLLGIAAPVSSAPPAPAPTQAPDDLDWELPTNPVPSPLEETQAAEPPPKSNPSGVGQKYEPKDTGAPAIVLTDEVKRAEAHARAQLDAEHKARSAPTVLKFKAIESPQKAALDDVDPSAFVPPKKGLGVWIGLGAGAVSVALIGIMLVARTTSSPEPMPPQEVKVVAPPLQPEPPPPPPVAPAPEPAPEPAAPEPSAEKPAVEVAPVKEPEPPKPERSPSKPAAAPKPAPAPKPPKPVATAPKPAPAAPKPAPVAAKPTPSPKPAAAPKPASGGIVRDAPF